MPSFNVHVAVGGTATTFVYDRTTVTIGSADGNDLVLAHASVEPYHARLHLDAGAGRLAIEEPLGQPHSLAEKQRVQIGAYAITVEKAVDAEPDVQATFLAQIRAKPNDDDLRLVYRDWLLENEWDARAEYLDAMVRIAGLDPDSKEFRRLAHELDASGSNLPHDWRMAVSRAPIENCDLRFQVVCPKKWDELQSTETDGQRYCGACRKDVHYVSSPEEARDLAARGECIAFDPQARVPDWRTPPRPMPMMTMGAVLPAHLLPRRT